jgi:hypothetical protein
LSRLVLESPYKGLSADSEEKREPVGDIATAVVDSLKVLDLKRPIREVDIISKDHSVTDGHASARRRDDASMMTARRSPNWGPFRQASGLGGIIRRRIRVGTA